MFWHNFKYSVKTLLANKMLLFWTFIFPLVMGGLFKLAFQDIENNEVLKVFNVGIIDSEKYQNNDMFKTALNALSSENEDQLFELKLVSDRKKAEKLLEEEEIVGYLAFTNDDVKLTVKKSGVNETVLRQVIDEIKNKQKTIETLVELEKNKNLASGNNRSDQEIYAEKALEVMTETTTIKNISRKNLSYTMIEFYTLIAMTCLYGGIISMFIINYRLPNMCGVGKRIGTSPINKGKMLLGSLLASFITELFGVLLLFLFTVFVLNVDYGTNLPLIILLAIVGSFAGLSIGVLVATLFKTNENSKIGILIAVTMVFCFLSGMMGITMKYIIDKNMPILNIINPANMITDGLYSLYYYDTLDRYIFNLSSLLIFSLIMLLLSYKGLRRQKYDSI